MPGDPPEPGAKWIGAIQLLPYRLPEMLLAIAAGETVYVLEGEHDCDVAVANGLVATTNPFGAGKFPAGFEKWFADANVRIVAHKDAAGYRHAEDVRHKIAGRATSVTILQPKRGKDLADHFAWGYGVDDLEPCDYAASCETGTPESPPREPSGKDVLLEIIAEMELFHTPDGEAYATACVQGVAKHLKIGSTAFKRLISFEQYVRSSKPVSSKAIDDAVNIAASKACYDASSATREVHVRIAMQEDRIYLDLGADTGRAVEISPGAWQVVDDPPVRFVRPPHSRALPEPQRGGSVQMLRPFVNVGSDEDWTLVLAWLVMALNPEGPYPILIITGEQGSAKSTMMQVLRDLIDPVRGGLRKEPRDIRDLMISAQNSWIVSFDNISRFQHWMSDALCFLATGGGFSTRCLYTNDEEQVFDAQRPIMLNGIEDFATRGDLLDRAVAITLPAIQPDKRRNEREYWSEFEQVRPYILAALLDAVAMALKRRDLQEIDQSPRMADFANFATAAEPALGLEPGAVVRAILMAQTESSRVAIDASPIGRVLIEFMENETEWSGSATELLSALTGFVSSDTPNGWPKQPNQLSSAIKRVQPSLRKERLEVSFTRDGAKRKISIVRAPIVTTVITDTTSDQTSDATEPYRPYEPSLQVEDRHPDSTQYDASDDGDDDVVEMEF